MSRRNGPNLSRFSMLSTGGVSPGSHARMQAAWVVEYIPHTGGMNRGGVPPTVKSVEMGIQFNVTNRVVLSPSAGDTAARTDYRANVSTGRSAGFNRWTSAAAADAQLTSITTYNGPRIARK
jgi:hypothetical protein